MNKMIVKTKYGDIEGVSERNCTVYKGIPYAGAPVGEFRFKKPVKPKAWDGVYKADHFRARSLQGPQRGGFYYKEFYSNPDFETPQGEDCLYLNIWVPESAGSGDLLPVAVYVHGGAFLSGGGSNLPFAGNSLASRGVILVTINYRLGALGFLCHPFLAAEGENEAGGNLGLWDQVMAFKWVKENIKAFGGDPERITAFGQSAGAMSLQALALSGKLQGLVSGMILQSGGGYKNPLGELRDRKSASEIAEILFEELGADKDNRTDVLDKLMNTSEDIFIEKCGATIARCFKENRGMPFVPVLDGELLTDSLDRLTDRGSYLKVPYILGCNGDDITTESNTVKELSNNPMHLADISFAEKVSDGGGKAYVYYFDRKLPGDDAGAFHSAELWYVFGSFEYCWRPLEERDFELSEEMMGYWINFFKTGDPNPEELPETWAAYIGDDGFVKEFF